MYVYTACYSQPLTPSGLCFDGQARRLLSGSIDRQVLVEGNIMMINAC